MSEPELSWNFTDAQGRCFIAGTEVPRQVYAEFERVASGRAATDALGEMARRFDGSPFPKMVRADGLLALIDDTKEN